MLPSRYLFYLCCFFSIFLILPAFCQIENNISSKNNKPKLAKVERSFGLGFFRKEGYKDFFEPRVAFIKRKPNYSEVIEYSWRPMVIHDMPHKERIDLIRFSLNRYYFSIKDKRVFFGGGIGGNVVLFNDKLKKWAEVRQINLKDGVNGLIRFFCGYKISEIPFGNKKYPLVFRVNAFFSPPYKFGGELGRAGDRLKLSEVTAGISLSIE